mgnify:CR=1 FL=1
MKKISRRTFIKSAAVAGTAFAASPMIFVPKARASYAKKSLIHPNVNNQKPDFFEKSGFFLSHSFDDGGGGLAVADAHDLQAVAAAGARQFVDEFGHQDRACGAEGMSEGDGAAVGIHFRHVGV